METKNHANNRVQRRFGRSPATGIAVCPEAIVRNGAGWAQEDLLDNRELHPNISGTHLMPNYLALANQKTQAQYAYLK